MSLAKSQACCFFHAVDAFVAEQERLNPDCNTACAELREIEQHVRRFARAVHCASDFGQSKEQRISNINQHDWQRIFCDVRVVIKHVLHIVFGFSLALLTVSFGVYFASR